MAKPEQYRNFEEMENALQKTQKEKPLPARKKKLTTIKEFANLLRENSVPAPKQKP